jgi:hypothetical protein
VVAAVAHPAAVVVAEAVVRGLPVDEVPAQLQVQVLLRRAVEVPVRLLLLRAAVPSLLLCLALQRVVIRQLRLVAAVDKLVVAVVAVRAVVVAEVVEAVALRLWLVTRFAQVPQFPAWRSSMPCSQRAPIPMWHSARVVRKPVPAVVSAIRCSVQEPRRYIVQR